MKRSLLLVLLLAGIVAIIYSCSKTSENSNKPVKPTGTLAIANGSATSVTVRCLGNCSGESACRIEGVGFQYVQCSCSQCKMEVSTRIFKGKDTIVTTTIQESGRYPVYFLQSFSDHMKKTFPGKMYTLAGTEITDNQLNNLDDYVVTFKYEFEDRTSGTVTFAWNRMTGNTKKVDCTGTCDCRERYYFETGAIECTCQEDCHMTITEMGMSTRDNPPK